MAIRHIRLFVVNKQIVYIHHQFNQPDKPGNSVHAPHGDKVAWSAPDDGGFSIEFKTDSPFAPSPGAPAGAGAPGNPIISRDGSETHPEKLKTIGTSIQPFDYKVKLKGITVDPQIVIDDTGGSGGKPKQAQKKKTKKKKKK